MKTLNIKTFFPPAGLKRLFAYSEAVATGSAEYGETDTVFVSEDAANLVTSATGRGDWHLPVLDLDVPHRYVPSSTEGHGHLYLDTPLPWDAYVKLLRALSEAGILEYGYVDASIEKGATMVRKPGVLKPAPEGAQPGGFIPGDRVRTSNGAEGTVVTRGTWALDGEVSVRLDRTTNGTVHFFRPGDLTRTFSQAAGF